MHRFVQQYGLGISIKYGDHSREMELRVNQHALGVRVPQGDNLRRALEVTELLPACRQIAQNLIFTLPRTPFAQVS